jgi:hypothetical protein
MTQTLYGPDGVTPLVLPNPEHDVSMATAAELAREMHRREQRGDRLVLGFKPWEAFQVLATIQLACRHPDFVGESRELVESFVAHLQEWLAIDSPVSAQVCEWGWHQEFDDADAPQ